MFPIQYRVRYVGTNFSHTVMNSDRYVFNDIQFIDLNLQNNLAAFTAYNEDGTTNKEDRTLGREYGFTEVHRYNGAKTPYFINLSESIYLLPVILH
ncbi:MAG: hypothetical protein ACRCTJ_01460 [Brevinema sp.]